MLRQLLKTNILLPIDFSEASFKLLDEILMSGVDPSQIYVIHVLHQLSPTAPAVIWQTTNDETRINNVKKAFWESHQKKLYQQIHFQVVIGDDISGEIIKYAAQENIGMIIIPTHGYKGFSHFLKGSIAEQVMRQRLCPVLVVPRKEAKNNYGNAETIKQLERIFQELS